MGLTSGQRDLIRRELNKRARLEQAETEAATQPAQVTDVTLLRALSFLSVDEREVWIDRYVLGDPLARIGGRMGLDRVMVRRLEHSANRRLEQVIDRQEEAA